MDPTTLVTFLYRASPDVRTVELIGSWDNFEQPYRMHHDRRRGQGFWSGCFKFDKIIFDGDGLQCTKPRNGGLKQGGTYFYYYRLNYDFDAFDDRQPHTTACPLMPGQEVNVIDVPVEILEAPSRCVSASGDIVGSLVKADQQQTMDPASKMAPVVPPPVSKVHARCLSDEQLHGRLEQSQRPLIVVHDTVSPLSSSCSPDAPPPSTDVHALQQDYFEDVSRASSAYPPRSAHSAPVSVLSPSEAGDALEDRADSAQASFPYPMRPGPGPLGSFEALGAALFGSTDVLNLPPPVTPLPDEEPINDSHHRRKLSEATFGPQSIANVQFYGSRPGTSLTHDPEQHRPRMYSLPSQEILDYHEEGAVASPDCSFSPRDSGFHDEIPTPGDEIASLDLASPTFSAATISTGGENTPFRLSAQNSNAGSTRARADSSDDNNGSALAAITERLRLLGRRSGREHDSSSNSYTLASSSRRPGFLNYSLPTIASASDNSLAKTASNPSVPRSSDRQGLTALPPPAIGVAVSTGDGDGRSMAEDIFSQLGF